MAGSARTRLTGVRFSTARGSTMAVSRRELTWSRYTRSTKRWKLAASVSMARSGSRASRANRVSSSVCDWISGTGSVTRPGHLLEARGYLVEGLGQRLVELGVGLRRASQGGVHLHLAGELGGVADIVGGWLHVRWG